MDIRALLRVQGLVRQHQPHLASFTIPLTSYQIMNSHHVETSDSTSAPRLLISIVIKQYTVSLGTRTSLISWVYSFWPVLVWSGWGHGHELRDIRICGSISRWIYRCQSQVQYSQHTNIFPLFLAVNCRRAREGWTGGRTVFQKKHLEHWPWEAEPGVIFTARTTSVPLVLAQKDSLSAFILKDIMTKHGLLMRFFSKQ